MQRFFFKIHSEKVFDDESGTLLADEAAARAHARIVIQELKATDNFDNANWRVTVTNEIGTEVETIPFEDVA